MLGNILEPQSKKGLLMAEWLKAIPFAYNVYLKIAEPRFIRILLLGLYICMIFAGVGVSLRPPSSFENVAGSFLVYTFSAFVTFGSILSAIAVLPGIWWLERVGIIALGTGMLMYTVVITALGASQVAISVALALVIICVIRWVEIHKYQLAPVAPRED